MAWCSHIRIQLKCHMQVYQIYYIFHTWTTTIKHWNIHFFFKNDFHVKMFSPLCFILATRELQLPQPLHSSTNGSFVCFLNLWWILTVKHALTQRKWCFLFLSNVWKKWIIINGSNRWNFSRKCHSTDYTVWLKKWFVWSVVFCIGIISSALT